MHDCIDLLYTGADPGGGRNPVMPRKEKRRENMFLLPQSKVLFHNDQLRGMCPSITNIFNCFCLCQGTFLKRKLIRCTSLILPASAKARFFWLCSPTAQRGFAPINRPPLTAEKTISKKLQLKTGRTCSSPCNL